MSNYQVMPELTAEEYAELKADISQRGVMIPIEYDENGHVLDGYHRLQICKELGIKDFPKVIRAGMTETEKLTHARKLNIARRHLTQEQKRTLIREQLKETPEQSDRQIAKSLGVNHETVGIQRKQLEAGGEIRHLDTSIGTDGKEYPRQIEHKRVISQFIVPSSDEVFTAESSTGHEDSDERNKNNGHVETIKPHVSYNSGNNEWYTPEEYITLAREVMGSIDLDPASSDKANEVVQALRYYTAKDNGLSQEWYGNIWLNPPYSAELITKFADKFIAEIEHISQAIILVNNATETEWFNKLANKASAVCFPKGRVKFYAPNGEIGAPLQGQSLLYYGVNTEKFRQKFQVKGWCALLQ